MSYIVFVLVSAVLLSTQVLIGTNSFKDKALSLLGEKLFKSSYRFIYVALSIAIYVICFALFTQLETLILVDWQDVFSNVIFLILDTIRFLALFLIIEALWELDLYEFLGFKQLWFFITRKDFSEFKRNRLRGKVYEPKGLYLRHRQPVFFYLLVFFILDRTLSLNNILFLVIFYVYYHFNSKQQEERLIEDYGDSYKTYHKQVRKYWPMWKRFPVADDTPKK
jgi:protein-S-isoprenylcysteine O-methyltransferase Ste14